MNGAEKLIKAMKKVNESSKTPSSELVYATVTSTSPLTFQLSNRLELTSEFYTLSNIETWSELNIGDKVTAFSFNDGQHYYIQEKVGNKSYSMESMNKQLNGITDGTTQIKYTPPEGSSSTATTINEVLNQTVGLSIYSATEQVIGTWINGKPIYRKVIVDTNSIGSVTFLERSYSLPNATTLINSIILLSGVGPLPVCGPASDGSTRVEKSDYIYKGKYYLTLLKATTGAYEDRTLQIIIEYIKS